VGAFRVIIDDQRFDNLDFRWEPSDATRFALDISAWAGKTVTLGVSLVFDGAAVIDSIAFVPALNWLLLIEKNPPVSGQPPSVTLILVWKTATTILWNFVTAWTRGQPGSRFPARRTTQVRSLIGNRPTTFLSPAVASNNPVGVGIQLDGERDRLGRSVRLAEHPATETVTIQ
jgi:hypothetical protein